MLSEGGPRIKYSDKETLCCVSLQQSDILEEDHTGLLEMTACGVTARAGEVSGLWLVLEHVSSAP